MPSQNLIIKAATMANGSRQDLFIENGRFVAEAPAQATTLDADGLIALPGLVDLHTHLREPGGEEAETIATGTAAAARGGFTSVFAMANTNPVTDSVERVRDISSRAEDAPVNVYPVASITVGLNGERLSPIADLAAAGVRLFSDDGKCVMDAGLMREAMDLAAKHDVVMAQHSQDHHLAGADACADEKSIAGELGLPGWPWPAESAIIARDAQLAELTGARLHVCHVSTAESVDVVRWAKKRGIAITAEATPHHLLLTSEQLRGLDTTFKVNPPLRGDEDVEAVRAALADGTIDVIGTDHAPHLAADKSKPFPQAKPGMVALEQALSVALETMINPGRIDWTQLVSIMSTTPAKIGRICDRAGRIAVDAVADLVLVDPSRRAVVDPERSASKGRNNPYAGLDLPEPVRYTVRAGAVTYAG